MRDFSLGTKLMIGFGLAIGIIMAISVTYALHNDEKMFGENSEYTSAMISNFVTIALTDAMAGGRNDELPELLNKIQEDEAITDIHLFRSDALPEKTGYYPRDGFDRQVLADGTSQSFYDEESHLYRTVFAFVADGACLDCHDVASGTILGGASISVSQAHLAGQLEANASVFTLMSIAIVIVMLGTIFVINRQLLEKPLHLLIQAAQRFAEGDTRVEVDISRGDEIGALATVFNSMTEKIRESLVKLGEQNHSARAAAENAERARQSAEQQREYFASNVATLLDAMKRFSNGDLTVSLPEEGDDSVGQLFHGFNLAVRQMQKTLHHVQDSVMATYNAANEISSASEQLSAGALEQSQQAVEVAAAMEEMTATITSNANNASQTAEIADRSGDIAREGGIVVQKTIEKISTIAEVVQNSSATVANLGESGKKIGEIISVIDEIADQTNLLALNAAIEAARAGEQGKGFAVVADEVRKLAERTSASTKEIAGMIETIQADTLKAVNVIQNGNTEVSEGLLLANQAEEALENIVKSAENVVAMINQIASASREQSTTSTRMAQNIDAISTVSSESAQGIAQIAEGSETLKQMADGLRKQMDHFRINRSISISDRQEAGLCNSH